ncbi:hypothetical protein AYO20_00041 [Fonsecaea nubica]|uniref:Uncharacterized protein n=1 Tax=Fonsecaea nubica TaxID=856822 RepID=A0A178DGX9_9EURO|nr:hypothetical protein AYO20_00041 [Fonsecaea nubica]OAL40305.1 hypothetical protein AYO20_00041 [Fonsecaea nubica]
MRIVSSSQYLRPLVFEIRICDQGISIPIPIIPNPTPDPTPSPQVVPLSLAADSESVRPSSRIVGRADKSSGIGPKAALAPNAWSNEFPSEIDVAFQFTMRLKFAFQWFLLTSEWPSTAVHR